MGWSHDDVYESCRIDRWFLAQLQDIVDLEARVKAHGLPGSAGAFRQLKAAGFSTCALAVLTGQSEEAVRAARHALGVRPAFKRIDTCAAEFASPTPYMYSTYAPLFAGALADEAEPSDRRKVMISAAGPNRIGQGIEFDYCCCHAAFALSDAGYETIMVNCNPETVSTDYDTSDRLYFEPLTAEDVLEIVDSERRAARCTASSSSSAGRRPLKLARTLERAGVPILGTQPDAIDLAEDRDRFKRLLDKLRLKQPANGIAYSVEQARLSRPISACPSSCGPSYVLGGRAMAIIRDEAQFQDYLLGTLPSLIPSDVKSALSERQDRPDQHGLGPEPAAFRSLPVGCDRGRR
jgi:carbamoyl-phosphate synthase large subunit